jgi:hypothetical protein
VRKTETPYATENMGGSFSWLVKKMYKQKWYLCGANEIIGSIFFLRKGAVISRTEVYRTYSTTQLAIVIYF